MSSKKLNDVALIKFIRSYKEKECLWNKRSGDYNNVMLKITSYNQLSKEFDMNALDVKRLINKLKKGFITEWDKVAASEMSTSKEPYKPQIPWYHEMLFFADILQINRKTQRVDNEHDYVEYLQDDVYTVPNYPSPEAMIYPKSVSTVDTSTISTQKPTSSYFDDAHESDKNDEIDQFCKSLAAQLMQLPVRSMIQLQMEIQNLISIKRLKELTNSK